MGAITSLESAVNYHPVKEGNISMVNNLGTLLIYAATLEGNTDATQLARGLELKMQLLQQPAFDIFIALVSGNQYLSQLSIAEKETIASYSMLRIVDELVAQGALRDALTTATIVKTVNTFPSPLREKILDNLPQHHIGDIKTAVDDCRNKRKEKPEDGEAFGEELYNTTLPALQALKLAKEPTYQDNVNSVVLEMVECTIGFFNLYRDHPDYNPKEPAMHVLQLARNLSPTSTAATQLNWAGNTVGRYGVNDARLPAGRDTSRDGYILFRVVMFLIILLIKFAACNHYQ